VEHERLRALDVVERSDLGSREKIESVVEETCFAFDLRRPQCSLRAARRLGAQLGCTFEEGGACGDSPARSGTICREHELGGDVFVRGCRGLGTVPCSPIGSELRIGCLGKRAVCLSPFSRCRRAIDGGADKRVAKGTALADLEQPGLHCRIRRFDGEPEVGGCAQQKERVAERLGSGEYEQLPRLVRQLLHAAPEALFDPVGK
jgi:hypothetical protein